MLIQFGELYHNKSVSHADKEKRMTTEKTIFTCTESRLNDTFIEAVNYDFSKNEIREESARNNHEVPNVEAIIPIKEVMNYSKSRKKTGAFSLMRKNRVIDIVDNNAHLVVNYRVFDRLYYSWLCTEIWLNGSFLGIIYVINGSVDMKKFPALIQAESRFEHKPKHNKSRKNSKKVMQIAVNRQKEHILASLLNTIITAISIDAKKDPIWTPPLEFKFDDEGYPISIP